MYFIKAPVFPWQRFPGSDVVLGSEMRSTGEVMESAGALVRPMQRPSLEPG